MTDPEEPILNDALLVNRLKFQVFVDVLAKLLDLGLDLLVARVRARLLAVAIALLLALLVVGIAVLRLVFLLSALVVGAAELDPFAGHFLGFDFTEQPILGAPFQLT